MTSSPNRLLAAVFGAVYLLVGLAGFVVTSGVGFAATEGRNLLLFEVNPCTTSSTSASGRRCCSRRAASAARGTNVAIGAVYLLVGVVGLFLVDTGANIIALNGADNVLHLASALLLLGVGLAADREDAGRTVTA